MSRSLSRSSVGRYSKIPGFNNRSATIGDRETRLAGKMAGRSRKANATITAAPPIPAIAVPTPLFRR